MERAIDADQYMGLLKEQYLHSKAMHETKAARAWQGAMQLLYDMPTIPPPNEPLTCEELRKMNEEPVWVQNLEKPEESQWRLLYWDKGKYLVLQGMSVRGYLLEEYGDSWLAYRHPKEGEEAP